VLGPDRAPAICGLHLHPAKADDLMRDKQNVESAAGKPVRLVPSSANNCVKRFARIACKKSPHQSGHRSGGKIPRHIQFGGKLFYPLVRPR